MNYYRVDFHGGKHLYVAGESHEAAGETAAAIRPALRVAEIRLVGYCGEGKNALPGGEKADLA